MVLALALVGAVDDESRPHWTENHLALVTVVSNALLS
jgi:hypothetical protein